MQSSNYSIDLPIYFCLFSCSSFQMHHSMDQLDMLDPTGSMTTLAPISESPLTPTHQHLHGSYHSMNHMMSHHHPGTLSGHTAGELAIHGASFPYPEPNFSTPFRFSGHHGHSAVHHPVITAAVAAAGLHPDTDTDPRELEAFAERFKQRRIKLGKLNLVYPMSSQRDELQSSMLSIRFPSPLQLQPSFDT